MRITTSNITHQTPEHREDTAIDIPPPSTIKDLIREEMRVQRNPDLEKRISGIFENFLLFCLAGITAYYFSSEKEKT